MTDRWGLPYRYDSETVGYTTTTTYPQRWVFKAPAGWENGDPILIYCGGTGEVETAPLSDAQKASITAAVLAAGWAISAVAGGITNWGNPTSITANTERGLALPAVSPKVILSQSMGGIAGLRLLSSRPFSGIVGWAGIYPACNLGYMHSSSSFTSTIRTAHGVAGDGSDYASVTSGRDPYLLAASTYAGVRMRFYASTGDTVVDSANNSTAMAALVAGHATESSVVACTGNHGNDSHFQPSDLSAFLARCVA